MTNAIFSIFETKNIIFWLQLGPQLGDKNLTIFVCFASRSQKTWWEPQNPPKPALDASRNLRKPRKWTSGHWKSAFFLPHCFWKHKKSIRKHRLLPTTQISSKLRHNLPILGTFGPILGNSAFSPHNLDCNHPPRISSVKIYWFWARRVLEPPKHTVRGTETKNRNSGHPYGVLWARSMH